MTSWREIIFAYICPTIGIFTTTALYSAPVNSLRDALERKSLGNLNPTPWGIMTGNCFGWLTYAYYSGDPFVVVSNTPGFVISLWLNSGASRLQYYTEYKSDVDSETENLSLIDSIERGVDVDIENKSCNKLSSKGARRSSHDSMITLPTLAELDENEADALDDSLTLKTNELDGSIVYIESTIEMDIDSSIGSSEYKEKTPKGAITFTPQEELVLGILSIWITVLLFVGWIKVGKGYEKEIVGTLANVNLVFLYGAPLQTIKAVFVEKNSDSIHIPTMVMTCLNAGLKLAYGVAIEDPVVIAPNGVGLLLGLCQAVLCGVYSKKPSSTSEVSIGMEDDTNHHQIDEK